MGIQVAAAAASTPVGRRIMVGVLGAAALIAVIIAAAIGSLVGSIGSQSDSGTGAFEPSAVALADIPANMLALYLDAGQTRGIDWAIIAAIGKIESDHDRSTAIGVHSGVNFAHCCAGPMQFSVIGPGGGTWGAYGVDGNHDGAKDVYDPADAVPAAADYLKASGAPGDYSAAIFAYNHSPVYVADVLAKAAEYRGALTAAGGIGLNASVAVNAQNATAVLHLATGPHPRITLTPVQTNDLATGQIDARITSLLIAIAQSHTITISALKNDHPISTTNGNISNHSAGRAVDMAIIDGEVCNSHVHGTTGKCWALAVALGKLSGPLHPTELIYGIDPDGPGPAFACLSASCGGDHSNHIHAGFDGP